MAIGLATFAIDGEAVASSNRTARAAVEVGADRVLHVQYQLGHDPVDRCRLGQVQGEHAGRAGRLPVGGLVGVAGVAGREPGQRVVGRGKIVVVDKLVPCHRLPG